MTTQESGKSAPSEIVSDHEITDRSFGEPHTGLNIDEAASLISRLDSHIWNEEPSLALSRTSIDSQSSSLDESARSLLPAPERLSIVIDNTDVARYSRSEKYIDVDALAPWIPQLKKPSSLTSRRIFTLWSCFLTTFIITITNLSLTIVTWRRLGDQGLATVYQGNCTTASTIDAGLHVAINILSTLQLGASNLCLQLTVAPTRQEVDDAHKKDIWLEIGVPSFRNLRFIPNTRKLIFACLALSSFPIHFLYNSVVFSSVTTNVFNVVVATEDFLTGPTWSSNTVTGYGPVIEGTLAYNLSGGGSGAYPSVPMLHNQYLADGSSFENMSSWKCIDRFIETFQWRPNVILISSDVNATRAWKNVNSSILAFQQDLPIDGGWVSPDTGICGMSSGINCLDWKSYTNESKKLNPWIGPSGIVIDYCLVAPSIREDVSAIESCQVQSVPVILLVVTICDVIKCICIMCVVFKKRDSLCTIGDAMASFLENPDASTKNLGVCDWKFITQRGFQWSKAPPSTIKWTQKSLRWWQAASVGRWIFTLIASAIVIVASSSTIISGAISLSAFKVPSSRFYEELGFGRARLEEVITWRQPSKGFAGVFANLLIANIWQVLISYLYMAHNALLSCMLVAEEWTGFRTERKTLRVSVPRGIQRSSYFLSMPLKYGIPMMVTFSVEHWLVSQSIFVISMVSYDWDGINNWHYFTTGFSIIPAFCALAVGILLVTAQILNAYLRRYPSETAMPLAASCSAAISAACHCPAGDEFAALMPVQWGVTSEDKDKVKKCAFTTARDVTAPLEGDILQGQQCLNIKSRSIFSK